MRYCTGLVVIEEVLEPQSHWFKTTESNIDISENCRRSIHKFLCSFEDLKRETFKLTGYDWLLISIAEHHQKIRLIQSMYVIISRDIKTNATAAPICLHLNSVKNPGLNYSWNIRMRTQILCLHVNWSFWPLTRQSKRLMTCPPVQWCILITGFKTDADNVQRKRGRRKE